jgi:RNase H-like domain found in reverse transcriptase
VKCHLLCKEAEWYGRKISKEGIKFKPKQLSGLTDAASPTNAAELQQFLCASNWMRHIPRYAELADPLLRLSRQCQDDVGSSKQKLRLYRLSKLSDAAMEMQFVQLRDAIVKRVTLSHPDSAQALCLYTDASQELYATVLTQMPVEDMEKHTEEQRHESLAFISGQFVTSSYNWSVPEKEAFEIVAAKTG